MTLPVAALYESVQREAMYAGTPAVFIRLQGCDVGCPFCDRHETWELNPEREITVGAMLAKEVDTSGYANVAVASLLLLVRSHQARHVVITGGEPCQYDLTSLTEGLAAGGYTAQIETSGTKPLRMDPSVWLTVSPKIDMPGGFPVLWPSLARADEIKMPVARPADIRRLERLLASAREYAGWTAPEVWLQPLNASPKATSVCLAACLDHGWKLCVPSEPVEIR